MIKGIIQLSILSIVVLLLASCNDYQKALKSTDYNYKYEQALSYYDGGDYYRAQALLEELVHILKGSARGDTVLYYYANCHFMQEDYILGAYYFETFAATFPYDDKTPDATYTAAYCYYLNSPKPSLDQADTKKAIDAMQLFINKYPDSDRVKEANDIIEKLRAKLELKAYESAKLYFKLSDYQAASISLKNNLKDYPDTKYREEILYLIIKSSYLLAENSILAKQGERYQNTISEYYTFVDDYPESAYVKEVEKMYEQSINQLKKL